MFEMSDEAQTIKVYNFLADTKEFIGISDCYIPPVLDSQHTAQIPRPRRLLKVASLALKMMRGY